MVTDVLEKVLSGILIEIGIKNDGIRVIKSNRPDLCDYQCDCCFKLSKELHESPVKIATRIVDMINAIKDFNLYFSNVEVCEPGFINMILSDSFINNTILKMYTSNKFSIEFPNKIDTFVIDYGGANVAKPLHVGHMRSAIIGESVNRIIKYMGQNTISDVHLGDFGLQIGEVIYGILNDKIKLDELDIKYLDVIYPKMSRLCKENEEIKKKCEQITKELQEGNVEYLKMWKKIVEVSIYDIKKNYDYLGVKFDYWYGESDAYNYLDEMFNILTDKKLLCESEKALVVDICKADDKKKMPPLIFKKSNGAYLYTSTDLACILQRKQDFNPNHIIYITDLRQALHFEQVFRVAYLIDLMPNNSLEHLGYGTVNGTDGKPYKTRSGETPKLLTLFDEVRKIFISKKETNKTMSENNINIIVNAILKFADLQNSRERDYVFDINKFSETTGKTGPYVLYTYLRTNKIINKFNINVNKFTNNIYNSYDRNLRLMTLELQNSLYAAYNERKPNYIVDYVYNLCTLMNIFYQNNKVLGIEDIQKQNDWAILLDLTNKIIKEMLNLLIIDIPTEM